MAKSIAKNYADICAIVITMGDNSNRIGTSFNEVKESCYGAVHYSFCFEGDAAKD